MARSSGRSLDRLVHELNSCGSTPSSLYDEGLGNFFLDDPFRYEAMIVIPDVEMQHRLVALYYPRSMRIPFLSR